LVISKPFFNAFTNKVFIFSHHDTCFVTFLIKELLYTCYPGSVQAVPKHDFGKVAARNIKKNIEFYVIHKKKESLVISTVVNLSWLSLRR
jgi:hypothetical protein